MPSPECHDLVVVGAGPAGLATAIYGQSERIDALLLDSGDRPGGQAVRTSRIENYPGFPDGVTGPELMGSMSDQAAKFGAVLLAPTEVIDLSRNDEGILVTTSDAETFLGRAAVIATGVNFRRLRLNNLAWYLGRGASYGPPSVEEDFHGKRVYVVGGANSAGQAADHLSAFEACEVHLLVRGESIEDKMSGYLVDRVSSRNNITIHTQTELVGVSGNGRLNEVSFKTGNAVTKSPADELFIMVGGEPHTHWLPLEIHVDQAGFVMAGSDLPHAVREAFAEATHGRQPLGNETSMPGLFVAGDARCGTTKRVGSAVGDGTGVVSQVHRYRSFAGS